MKGRITILTVSGIIGVLAAAELLPVQAEEYQYDALKRVKEVIYEDGSSVVYEYDSNGNIVRIEVNKADSSAEAEEDDKDGKTPGTEENGQDEKTPETEEDGKDGKTPETEENGQDEKKPETEESGKEEETPETEDDKEEETPETEETDELPFPEKEKDRWSIIKALIEQGIEGIGKIIHLIESLYFWK